ncbi:hypothetical protein [Streptomyces sp. NPDC056987]|uniref:hypothetical protein n=1 Tax=Streptomyces sp. NPDC056987 TaxID=3345988 RepID=UPI003625459A
MADRKTPATDAGRSEARRRLSLLIAAYGVDGTLVVPAAGYAPGEGADLTPGSALRWPPCECGHALCPDAPDASGPSGAGQ